VYSSYRRSPKSSLGNGEALALRLPMEPYRGPFWYLILSVGRGSDTDTGSQTPKSGAVVHRLPSRIGMLIVCSASHPFRRFIWLFFSFLGLAKWGTRSRDIRWISGVLRHIPHHCSRYCNHPQDVWVWNSVNSRTLLLLRGLEMCPCLH
jgi:hypothetical protein